MNTEPRSSKLVKKRISDGALLCAPIFPSPPSFLTRAFESYEYRKDRRRIEEQYEAYHTPPSHPAGMNFRQARLSSSKSETSSEPEHDSWKRRTLGSFRSKRRSEKSSRESSRESSVTYVENDDLTVARSSGRKGFLSEAGSLGSLSFLLEGVNVVTRKDMEMRRSGFLWGGGFRPFDHPFMMTADPPFSASDPWELPPLRDT